MDVQNSLKVTSLGMEYESGSLKLERFKYTSAVDGLEDWFLYHHQGESRDCAIVLHGHGSHGNQVLKMKGWIPLWEEYTRKYDLNLFTPNLRDDAWMCPAAVEDLAALIRYGKENYKWQKVIIATGSMGATGALIFAVRHPELVSGIAALGAATDLKSYLQWCETQTQPVHESIRTAIKAHYQNDEEYAANSVLAHAEKLTMPVWFIHGDADATIPVSQARELAKLMAGKKNFYYEEIPGGNHNSPLPRKKEGIDALFNFFETGSFQGKNS